MSALVHLGVGLLALPALAACLYLLVLTLLANGLPVPPRSDRRLRFDIIVPAHDEAASIERVIASLLRMDWPRDGFRVNVVADNCSDATAAIARAAGARVLERHDEQRRGKGYALDFAFQAVGAEGWSDAVVVVDADSETSTNLLEAYAARLAGGAGAVQAHYGVLNPWASWRTRLMTIAQEAFHTIRSRARERLGLSCGLRGTGWCVTHELLRQVPYRAYSLTEDVEYSIDLGLAGHRVLFAGEATCDGEMVTGAKAAGTQRERWERGRFQLVRSRTAPLLRAAWRRRDPVCLDLALDLLLPPLSYVALMVAAFGAAAAAANLWQPQFRIWAWLAAGCGASLGYYVLRGWQLSGMGARGLLDLAAAPAFIGWKLLVMARRGPVQGWIRTDREKR
jgi:cellulose synthase/poly-beta-1,6-N-acetylglucosamine synthase-like glycosyltransferase